MLTPIGKRVSRVSVGEPSPRKTAQMASVRFVNFVGSGRANQAANKARALASPATPFPIVSGCLAKQSRTTLVTGASA